MEKGVEMTPFLFLCIVFQIFYTFLIKQKEELIYSNSIITVPLSTT